MKLRFSTIALALLAQTALLSAPPALAQNAEAQADSAAPQKEPSKVHQALAWSQDRLAQLDANITALEKDASKLRGEARTKADAALADLRKQRDAYRRRAQDAAANARTGAMPRSPKHVRHSTMIGPPSRPPETSTLKKARPVSLRSVPYWRLN